MRVILLVLMTMLVASAPHVVIAKNILLLSDTSSDAKQETLRVAILGDRTGLARPGVFEKAVQQVNLLRPDLVVMVGDLLEGYTADGGEITREWEEAEQTVAGIEAEFIWVPGNHDLSNAAMLTEWRSRRGAPWFSFVRKDILFVMLDSEDPPQPMPPKMEDAFRKTAGRMRVDPVGAATAISNSPPPSTEDLEALRKVERSRISRDQVDFVRRTLAEHQDAPWTVVVIHKPAWKEGNRQFADIERLLSGRNYMVIAGHEHEYSHERRFGMDYIVMGPTGALPPRTGPLSTDRMGWLTLGGRHPEFATVLIDGIAGRKGPNQ